MAAKHGNLSINSDNLFPIIKKWLYSDQDIFYRELISNGCDAITKLKKLEMMGEYTLPNDYKGKIEVIVSPEKKTIVFKDNGLGMTADEVEEYINQIAFSGATDFIEKYKDKANEDQIIGHFGLGFYSAFMVADKVEIKTLSYKEGATAVHWTCDGGTEFDMEDCDKSDVGTEIILHVMEDCLKFVNKYEAEEVLKKYCSFMPSEIYLTKDGEELTETIKESEKLDTDVVIEEVKEEGDADKKDAEKKLKIKKRPVPINETQPLWAKHPNECTKEEYLDFYRKVFKDYKEPLFWIHLNMDYPFNLKGILYFPKINMEYESVEGVIKLYNNQVFIADNIKEVIPEFLMLLKGVIDCPDLPLNVSRSALQNDGFVKKISDYISKKVADKLAGMCKTERDEYVKYWDDISPFIKYGCLKDEKFCEKMNDYIMFKNIDGKYETLPECLDVKPIDIDEDGNAVEGEAVDADGNKVEAEVVNEGDNAKVVSEGDNAEADDNEPKGKHIYYVTDEQQQSQYINMFKKAKKDAIILTHNIDQPFIQQLESKNEGVKFLRIDADLTEDFKAKTSKKVQEELDEKTKELEKIFKKAIKKDNLTVKVEKLKNKSISSMLTVSEESRRMQDMMKMYSMPGMDMSMFGKEGQTLILNDNNKLVQKVLSEKEGDKVNMICEQLYDLAQLQNAPLSPEAMTKFIERSNKLMELL